MESLELYAQYVQFPFLLIRIVDALVIFGLLEQFSTYLLWVTPPILKALEPLKVSTLKKKYELYMYHFEMYQDKLIA